MKKIIFVLLMFVGVVACNKNLETANKIEGSWVLISTSSSGKIDENPNGKGTVLVFSKYEEDNGLFQYQFKNIFVDDYNSNGIYSILNDGKLLNIETDGISQSFNFSIVKNELRLNSINKFETSEKLFIKK